MFIESNAQPSADNNVVPQPSADNNVVPQPSADNNVVPQPSADSRYKYLKNLYQKRRYKF